MMYQLLWFVFGIYVGQEYKSVPNIKMVTRVGLKELQRYINSHEAIPEKNDGNKWIIF